jgi:hypothetical protein
MSFKLQPVSSKQPDEYDEDSEESIDIQEPKNKRFLKKVSLRSKNIHKCSSKQSCKSGKYSGIRNRQSDASMISDDSQELSDDGSFQTGSQFEDAEEEKLEAEE